MSAFRSRLLIALTLAITLVGSTNAQTICAPLVAPTFTIDPTFLIGFTLLALSVSLDVVAIGYIIGKLVPGTGLSSWISREFWEIAKSAILIGAIYSVLVFLGGIANTLVGNSISGSLSTQMSQLTYSAQTYLFNVYCGGSYASLSTGAQYLTALSLAAGGLNSLQVGYFVPYGAILLVFTGGLAPIFYGGTIFSPYQNGMVAITATTGTYESLLFDAVNLVIVPVSILVVAQFYLLPLLVVSGLALFVPLGIVFRAFPFVRGIGGTLVAIGIGISLIYPTLLVVVNGPVTNIVEGLNNPAVNSCASGNPLAWFIGLFTGNLGYSTTDVGYASGLCSFSDIYSALDLVTYYSLLGTVQYLLFIIDLIIAYPLINSIAKSLGGSITLGLGSRLKIA